LLGYMPLGFLQAGRLPFRGFFRLMGFQVNGFISGIQAPAGYRRRDACRSRIRPALSFPMPVFVFIGVSRVP